MGKPFCIFSLFLLVTLTVANCESEYTKLVYKGCAKQVLPDPYSQSLSSLFGTLISQSSKSKFYKTSQSTISGLFQCRGDLSNVDCYNCVSGMPVLIDKLCGKPVAARIQLLGCYMLYEVSGFPQISGMEMLFKTCSGKNAPGSGFEEIRDTAFNSLENGMPTASNGFYTSNFQGVYALAQCEGDVGSGDCGDCVKIAVQKAQVECGSSVSGQIFLHKCYVNYNYYPDGVPKTSPSSWSPSSSSSGTGQNVGKTVAIIVGGVAGVGFILICLLFARNLMKKHDDY